jgi:SNF2 family DNA or RNA helicase
MSKGNCPHGLSESSCLACPPSLWEHQRIAIERAKTLHGYALHFEAGTGKTRTALEILKHRFNTEKRIMRTLILCPPIVIGNWREEWCKYTKIDRRDVVALTGTGAQRLKTFVQNAYNEKDERRGKVFITNYESLLMKELYQYFTNWVPEITIQDESHRLKNPSSKMAKALDELVNKFVKPSLRLNLTGTAILNSPMDLFMQFKVLMGGFPTLDSLVTGKHITNYFTFRATYFEDKNAKWRGSENYYPNWQPKPSTSELFGRLLASVSMSVNKADCLDLPDEVDVTIPVPLTPQQRRDYDKFEKDMVLNIEGKNYTADIAMVRALRLMQIASGFISGMDFPDASESQPIKYEYKNTEREKALKELLEDICIEKGKKCLVWAVWKNNYEIIKKVCDELKIKYVECHGLVSAKGKEEARRSFIQDPTISVWIGHPYSGGIGVNLIVAPYTVWYSRNFSLEQYSQAKARNYRGGQTEKVTHYHLIAADTIEPEIVQALINKQNISDLIMSKTSLYKK